MQTKKKKRNDVHTIKPFDVSFMIFIYKLEAFHNMTKYNQFRNKTNK